MKLNAVTHDGYYSMYSYISVPSSKKPLSELDQQIFLSEHHPRGEGLRKLLEVGSVHSRAVAFRNSKKSADGQGSAKRIRAGDIYELVSSKRVGSVLELQALACEEAAKGNTRLAEFCTSMGPEKLGQFVASASSVLAAPASLALRQASRLDLLRRAASEKPCVCDGRWVPGAAWVLQNNREDITTFCRDVCTALELGAKRGTNIAIVGAPGCGKSMLLEPFVQIFKVMGTPESKSSFSLAGALAAQLLLWQDYKHNDSTILFEDVLSMLVGELIEVRIPHQMNVPFENASPLFYTSNSMLRVARPDPAEADRLNIAMAERFRVRQWYVPIPSAQRQAAFPKCARCCAHFYLTYR